MGKRLYYGDLLRATKYHPYYKDHPARFFLQLVIDYRVSVYEADTIDGIIKQVKAAGHQVWGSDLDYTMPPRTALEYVLMERALKQEGLSPDEIQREFSYQDKVNA